MEKRRSYDYAGFAAAVGVLAGVVLMWAVTSARVSPPPASAPAASAMPSGPTDPSVSGAQSPAEAPAPALALPRGAVAPDGPAAGNDGAGHAPAAPQAQELQPVRRGAQVRWLTSYETAMQQAQHEGKPMMVDFYAPWCVWCKKLDADVYTHPQVVSESARFVCVRVNVDQRPDLQAAYGASGLPYVVFVRSDATGNQVLGTMPGFDQSPNFPVQFSQLMKNARQRYGVAGSA